jgi:nucleotide-binding universal stress UspA family protein
MSIFPTKILLATDGSEDAALAARAAVDLSIRSGSQLHVVHVWQGPSRSTHVPTTKEDYPYLQDLLARELLEEQTERLESAGATVAGAHLRRGEAAEEIVRLSEELEVGILVLGSRGLGALARLVLGSVSEKVAYLTPCPVLVMRGGARAWPPQRVVVGEDRSEQAKRASEAALSIARLVGAQEAILVRTTYPELPLVPPGHHWQSWRTQRERAVIARLQERRRIKKALEKRASELKETLGRLPLVRAAVGEAADIILEVAAENAEPSLVAVGSRGLGMVKSVMLGSVSRKVLRTASGPVLIAP